MLARVLAWPVPGDGSMMGDDSAFSMCSSGFGVRVYYATCRSAAFVPRCSILASVIYYTPRSGPSSWHTLPIDPRTF